MLLLRPQGRLKQPSCWREMGPAGFRQGGATSGLKEIKAPRARGFGYRQIRLRRATGQKAEKGYNNECDEQENFLIDLLILSTHIQQLHKHIFVNHSFR